MKKEKIIAPILAVAMLTACGAPGVEVEESSSNETTVEETNASAEESSADSAESSDSEETNQADDSASESSSSFGVGLGGDFESTGVAIFETIPCYKSYEKTEPAEEMYWEAYYKYESNSYADSITLVVGDNSATMEIDAIPSLLENSIHVYTQDEKEYIYALTSNENDFKMYAIFEITGGNVSTVGQYACMGLAPAKEEELEGIEDLSKKPYLSTDELCFALGNINYSIISYIGDDGMLVPASDMYTITRATEDLTTLKDVPATIVENGVDTGKETKIPADTKVVPIATDGESVVDVTTSDGSVYRLHYSDFNDYPAKIGGVSIEKLFTPIKVAG